MYNGDQERSGNVKIPLFVFGKGGFMKEKIEQLLKEPLKELDMFVGDVYYTEEEGIRSLNIELDSDTVIDVERITKATKVINPLIDEKHYADDVDVLDIHSKEKGEEKSE